MKGQTSVQSLTLFSVQFLAYLRNAIALAQKCANGQTNINSNVQGLGSITQLMSSTSSTEPCSTSDAMLNIFDELVCESSKLVLKMNVMSIIYHHLFGNLDQKLFSTIVENNAKVENRSFFG